MSDPDAALEAWMHRNRARRAVTTLELKLDAAKRRRSRSILVPVTLATSLLTVARSIAARS